MPSRFGDPTTTKTVLFWASDLDDKTRAQAERSASLPFVAGHVALMPDAHYGYGATVGSVIATKGAIVPSAVGVDISCGMIAARLAEALLDEDPRAYKDIDQVMADQDDLVSIDHVLHQVLNYKGT